MSPPIPNQIRFSVEPRLVPTQKAARRLHLTEAEFKDKLPALQRAGFPVACSITGHYDLKAIDGWLDRRAGIGGSDARKAADVPAEPIRRRLGDRIGGRQQENSDPLTVAYERYQRGEISLDQLPPGQYGGMRIYADGEWEALLRKRPLGLNEKRALSGFYAKRGELSSIISGCGPKTIERLVAREFIKVVGHSNEAFIDTCKITPAGEAAWLAIADREGKDF